ncbi:HEPN domain-containing protein [Spirulina major]|uniref:HEPN domain-containing protein n=1 Tax=Spirulina major TaxID=270636 RepID=UPI00093460D3|nr:HEPN domain-containing protein [Spirulina major]
MKSKSQSLIFKAQESYRAAQVLAEQGFYGFAASRAYYGMFYIAEAFLWEQDLAFSSHGAVIAAFGRDLAKKGIVPLEFHRFLINAQSKRAIADYGVDDEVKIRATDAEILLNHCEQFILFATQNL